MTAIKEEMDKLYNTVIANQPTLKTQFKKDEIIKEYKNSRNWNTKSKK